jgi:hypothetical protein
MTIYVLIILSYKTAVFFVHDIVLSSSCCLCTNIYYVTILIGPCPVIIDSIFSYEYSSDILNINITYSCNTHTAKQNHTQSPAALQTRT